MECRAARRKVLGKRKTYTPAGARSMAVDSKEFLAQPSDAIAPEEMFLYQYVGPLVPLAPSPLFTSPTLASFFPGTSSDAPRHEV